MLPEEGRRRADLRTLAGDLLARAGYGHADTPIFEDTELFARGVGETTDIVQKEMFSFDDAGGRSLTLRPEGTAGICRAYVAHGMHKLPQPVKLWYWGPFFRYEAPQAGRFRQFTQVGAEALGSDDPSVDAEAILVVAELLERAGARGVRLRLSSLGSQATRAAYSDELRDYLRARQGQLSDEVVARLDANPLRAFDSGDVGTQTVLAGAPKLLDRLAPEDGEHLAAVRALLDDAGLRYQLDGTLVRGLDYYTRTVFEFTSDELGAQSGVAGGGRYDGLVAALGGPDTPAIGWAAGIERILLAAAADAAPAPGPLAFVAVADGATSRAGFALVTSLRRAGVRAEIEQSGRSLKGQLKHADRLGARALVIVGGGQLWARDIATGEQHELASEADALRFVLERQS